MMPYQNLLRPQGRVPWGTYPQKTLYDTRKGHIHTDSPLYRSAPRRLPGETPRKPDFGPMREPRGRKRPPNYDQETIANTHQFGGAIKICDKSLSHKGRHGQTVMNLVPFGTVREADSGLEPQDELLLLKIPPQNIQERYNTKESQKDQKAPSLCRLLI